MAFSHQSAAQGGFTRGKGRQQETQGAAKVAPKRPQRLPQRLPEAVSGALLEEKGVQKLNFDASLVKIWIFRKSRFYLSKSTDFEGSAAPNSKRFLGNRAKLTRKCDLRPKLVESWCRNGKREHKEDQRETQGPLRGPQVAPNAAKRGARADFGNCKNKQKCVFCDPSHTKTPST